MEVGVDQRSRVPAGAAVGSRQLVNKGNILDRSIAAAGAAASPIANIS